MTKLACRYGVDASAPEKGIIVEHAADDERIDMAQRPGCLYLEVAEPPEAWGRFGPEPARMGEAPTACFPGADALAAAGIPDDPQLRRMAGLPMPCNRRVEDDRRPWAAPDLTPDVARLAKRIEMAAAFGPAEAGGFDSEASGALRRYPSDADALTKLQLAALASLSGQSKPGWTATLRCAEVKDGAVGAFAGLPHKPGQVHSVLAGYQAFADALHAERDAIEARIAGTADVAAILAIARA